MQKNFKKGPLTVNVTWTCYIDSPIVPPTITMLALLTVFPYVLRTELGGLGSGENCSFSCCLDSLAAATTPPSCCIWFQLGSAEFSPVQLLLPFHGFFTCHLFWCTCCLCCGACRTPWVGICVLAVGQDWGFPAACHCSCSAGLFQWVFGLFQSLVTWTLPKAGWWKLCYRGKDALSDRLFSSPNPRKAAGR